MCVCGQQLVSVWPKAFPRVWSRIRRLSPEISRAWTTSTPRTWHICGEVTAGVWELWIQHEADGRAFSVHHQPKPARQRRRPPAGELLLADMEQRPHTRDHTRRADRAALRRHLGGRRRHPNDPDILPPREQDPSHLPHCRPPEFIPDAGRRQFCGAPARRHRGASRTAAGCRETEHQRDPAISAAHDRGREGQETRLLSTAAYLEKATHRVYRAAIEDGPDPHPDVEDTPPRYPQR